MLYYGYDTHLFLSDLLDNLKLSNGSIFLLNFSESIINKIYREGRHKILITETTRRYSLYSHSDVILLLSSRVLLLDLITNKISPDMIGNLIIGNNSMIESDSKEAFILKYMSRNPSTTKFIFINNNPPIFIQDFAVIKSSITMLPGEIKIEFFPRFHKIIERIIEYSFNVKNIEIFEYNLENENLIEIDSLLRKLYENCASEIIRYVTSELGSHSDEKFVDRCLGVLRSKNIGMGSALNTVLSILTHQKFFSYRSRILRNDLNIIQSLLIKLEYMDYPSILQNINGILKENNDMSYFHYKDSETQNLIGKIIELIKMKMFHFQKISTDMSHCMNYDVLRQEKYHQFIDLSNDVINIILNDYSITLTSDYFDNIYPKHAKLIEILSNIQKTFTSRETVLIITHSQMCTDNLKEILASHFIIKDHCVSFMDTKLRNFLLLKSEFIKRQKYLSLKNLTNGNGNENLTLNSVHSKYFIESLLLQVTCFNLCRKYDQRNENLFDQILKSYAITTDNLPSEIEVNEETFTKFETMCYQEECIISPHRVIIDSFGEDPSSGLIKFKEAVLKEKISMVIFFHFDLDLMRNLECIISSYDECQIKHIYIINTTNSILFSSHVNKIANEFKIFKKMFNDYSIFQKRCQSSQICNRNMNMSLSNQSNEKKKDRNKNILIDFREMSAKVPFYLYYSGFNIVVGGLEIGDYITSNSVCIERKSISTGDLIESLKGGRLVNQILKMQKYYEFILILCEFEDDVDLLINGLNNNQSSISSHFFKQKYLYKKLLDLKNVSSKILFTWSLHPQMTANILTLLKDKYNDYLDINKCININKNDNKKEIAFEIEIEKRKSNSSKNLQQSIVSFIKVQDCLDKDQLTPPTTNLSNYEEDEVIFDNTKRMDISIEKFIRKIDGVNTCNFDLIFRNFKNLKELIFSSKDKLTSIFGKINGAKIFYFFTTKYKNPSN